MESDLGYWPAITHLGNSVFLLGVAATLAAYLIKNGAIRYALFWMFSFGVAVLVVLLSKIAFMGWGIGNAAIDFTGVSGHSMLSTAVLPPLAVFLTFRQSARFRFAAVFLSFAIAFMVGISRLALDTHSGSEVVIGWAVGLMVSAPAIWLARQRMMARASVAQVAIIFCILFALTSPHGDQPGPETHGLITSMALWASGRSTPFTRQMLHEQSHPASKRMRPMTAS